MLQKLFFMLGRGRKVDRLLKRAMETAKGMNRNQRNE